MLGISGFLMTPLRKWFRALPGGPGRHERRRASCVVGLVIALWASQGRAQGTEFVKFLGGITSERDCVVELILRESRVESLDDGAFVRTVHTGEIRDVVYRGRGFGFPTSKGKRFQFLTEGGSLNDRVTLSPQSVSLKPGSRYVLFLKSYVGVDKPFLLDARLVGSGTRDRFEFRSFGVVASRHELEEIVATAHVVRAAHWHSEGPAAVTWIGPHTTVAVHGTPHGTVTRGSRSVSEIAVTGILEGDAPDLVGSTIDLDLPSWVASIPSRDLLLFVVRRDDGRWELVSSEYALWIRRDGLFYAAPSSREYPGLVGPGLSAEQIKDALGGL